MELNDELQDGADEALSIVLGSVYDRTDLPVEGDTVLSRPDGNQEQTEGKVMKGRRRCMLDGCGGVRIYVRWPGGSVTQPCSEGISSIAEHVWQIR